VLNINCLMDIKQFINQVKSQASKPLSLLTEGIHYHTIEVTDESMYESIINALNQHHYLY
ncbi:transcription repressor NadR, partial [Turicibacter sanguinis]|nr:transcription repressor NadR [Turicibacter sanguinis]